jgi:hypothetical protein
MLHYRFTLARKKRGPFEARLKMSAARIRKRIRIIEWDRKDSIWSKAPAYEAL